MLWTVISSSQFAGILPTFLLVFYPKKQPWKLLQILSRRAIEHKTSRYNPWGFLLDTYFQTHITRLTNNSCDIFVKYIYVTGMDSTFFEPCPHLIRKAGKCWRHSDMRIDHLWPSLTLQIRISVGWFPFPDFPASFSCTVNIRPVRIREFWVTSVTKHAKRSEVICDGEHPVEHGFRRDEFHPGRCGLIQM